MFFNNIKKKIPDSLVYPWNIGITCANCSQQFTVMRRKKQCVFCNAPFCMMCIERRPDKRLSCRKCIILTSRPIIRDQLFHLRSRDLVDYLSSRHISTSDCIEKEDLVNAVMRSVNPLQPSRSNSGSYPTTPQRSSLHLNPSTSRSHDDLLAADGIRVTGVMTSDTSSSSQSPDEPFVVVDHLECGPEPPSGEAAGSTRIPSAPAEVSADTFVGEELSPVSPPPDPVCTPELGRKWPQLSEINSNDDLEVLSIRQLKELLSYNRIDFAGCVEKTELLDRAKRLWGDYMDSRKEVENLDTTELCKVCMDAPMECVLLECGHIATCVQCGKRLSECPICRQYVIRIVRTFKA